MSSFTGEPVKMVENPRNTFGDIRRCIMFALGEPKESNGFDMDFGDCNLNFGCSFFLPLKKGLLLTVGHPDTK